MADDSQRGTPLGEALRGAADELEAAAGSTPRLDAELLLAHALGVSRVDLYTSFDRQLNPDELDGYRELVARRVAHEPVAYILGEWGFRRLTLTVDRRVLIPRPETEIVVERCLLRLQGLEQPRVLDAGVGSGAIALAIADEHPGAQVLGIDASQAALMLARENVARTGVRVELRLHDFRDDLPPGPWQLVVSNPPYVAPEELGTLMPDVREWEPEEALVGHGATDAIARGALDVLAPGGALVLEVGEGQAGGVVTLLLGLGYRDPQTTADLAGRDRVVEVTR